MKEKGWPGRRKKFPTAIFLIILILTGIRSGNRYGAARKSESQSRLNCVTGFPILMACFNCYGLLTQQVIQHLCHFGAGGCAPWCELFVAAAYDTGLNQQHHGIFCPGSDGIRVGEVGKSLAVAAFG